MSYISEGSPLMPSLGTTASVVGGGIVGLSFLAIFRRRLRHSFLMARCYSSDAIQEGW